MEVTITYDGNSRVLFEPLFDSEEYQEEIFDQENLTLVTVGGKSFLEMDGTSAHLLYRIEAPFPIERLDIRSNPRVFNDRQRKNAVSAFYSTDGERYEKIYEVRSDGRGDWAVYRDLVTGNLYNNGIYERETYDIVYPDSKVVYIQFRFEGYQGKVQLWSTKEGNHWLRFDARGDTSPLEKLPLEKGRNTLESRVGPGGVVTIATEGLVLSKNE